MTYSRWVTGGVLFAVALPVAGCGGWVDVDTSNAKEKAAASGGSTGGSGAPTPSDARYGFYVIPGLLEPGERAKDFDILAREVSDNGALVVGTTAAMMPPLPLGISRGAQDQLYSGDSRYFYWTPGDGTQPWEGQQSGLCLSGDGSAIFSYATAGPGNGTSGATRWTLNGGFQTIADADTYDNARVTWCSFDGKRAGGSYGPPGPSMRALLWSEGYWGDQPLEVSAQIPDGSFGWVSSVGTASIITSYGEPNHVYWSEGDDEPELLPQPDANCFAEPGSRDGKVVISFCEEAPGYHVYRWTAETHAFTSMGSVGWPDTAGMLSADGSAFAATSDDRLTYLKNGTTHNASSEESVSVMGLSDDASTVYVEQGGTTSKASRWTEADGLEMLESLPNLPCTQLTYPGFDGQHFANDLAAGLSSVPSELDDSQCAWSHSRAVLWDARGVRDIAAELKTAGVDLEGVELRRADRIWSESGVRVMGTGELANGALRTWIAQLPARE